MNPRELLLLNMLACHVRFLAVSQVTRAWFSQHRHGRRQASKLVQQLAASGWLLVSQILSRPISPLLHPLVEWRHAWTAPDFETVSKYLHRRANQFAHLTTVVSATEKTFTLFGAARSAPIRIKLTQATHDLHVAEVYLRYCHRGFEDGQRWVGEDALPETWPLRERPDAILVDQIGDFVRTVEYGGDYSVERLSALHDALASFPLAYEIW